MRSVSGSARIACAVLGPLVAGCLPSFDGLTGGAKGDASQPPAPDQGDASPAAPAPDGGDASPAAPAPDEGSDVAIATCVDPTAYPGGGIHKGSFADVSDMILNGSATVVGGALRLASVESGGVGSAYVSAPVAFDDHTSFFAHFAMRIGGGAGESGTDGMAFVLQSSPDGAKARGNGGGGLGYDGVTPSIAIEFDTFFNPATDPDGNHVAFLAGGNSSVHIAHATPPFRLNDGVVRNVWIDYDASVNLLEVYMAQDAVHPSMPLFTHDGASYMAPLGNLIYVGAAAATGTARNDHELLGEAWFVTSHLPKCR